MTIKVQVTSVRAIPFRHRIMVQTQEPDAYVPLVDSDTIPHFFRFYSRNPPKYTHCHHDLLFDSIRYKACVAVAMFAGISPNAIKLITAVLFLIILVVSMDRKKVKAC